VNNKCREYVDKIKRLITKEDYTPNAKIYAILLNVSKTFLATHLFDDSGDGLVELLNDKQLEHIQDTFFELSSFNICNLVASFKHHSRHGYIDDILELKFNNSYDYI
jgi:hypothetical protein